MITEDFVGYGARISVDFGEVIPGEKLNSLLTGFMSRISLDCVDSGVKLIGHIKSISEAQDDGYLACSVTNHDGKVRTDGVLGNASGFNMVLNVMIYGLDIKTVEGIVETRTQEFFSWNGTKVELEILEGEEELDHDHDHDHDHEHHANVHFEDSGEKTPIAGTNHNHHHDHDDH